MRFDMIIRLVFAALVATLILFTCSLVGGCEVLKHKVASSGDTTSVKKITGGQVTDISSGNVIETNTKTKEENEWWKTTIQYLATKDDGDTTINNYYSSTPQPYIVTMEGGKGSKDEETSAIDYSWFQRRDSMFYASLDSLRAEFYRSEKSKSSETKGVGLVIVLLLIGGSLVLFKVVEKYVGGYRVVKKVKNNQ